MRTALVAGKQAVCEAGRVEGMITSHATSWQPNGSDMKELEKGGGAEIMHDG